MPDPSREAWTERLQSRIADIFPFGLAPLLILVLTVTAGVYLALHPAHPNTADLRLWTFANTHAVAHETISPQFAQRAGVRVTVDLVAGDAIRSRLRAAFWSDLDVPDLVEVENTWAGNFFRGPLEDVGFIDLKPYLERSGLLDRMVRARFSLYSNRGRIYGLPHDVHPVMLAYRRDLFEELGIDPAKLVTWDDFVAAGRRVTREGQRYMMELADAHAGYFEALFYQAGGGYFSESGDLTMDDETAFRTLRWYIPLVAGPGKIGQDPGGGASLARALEDGYVLSLLAPDWRSKSVESDVPQLDGRMALMPLPAFTPGGRRTSVWGGTMIGITRACRNPELAWQWAEFLYTNTSQTAANFRAMNILPPTRDAWRDPAFAEPRRYWSGQAIGQLYIALADQVPAVYGSPFLELAKGKMGEVVPAAAAYYNSHGEDGFDDFLRQRLRQAADEVRRQMTRNPF